MEIKTFNSCLPCDLKQKRLIPGYFGKKLHHQLASANSTFANYDFFKKNQKSGIKY